MTSKLVTTGIQFPDDTIQTTASNVVSVNGQTGVITQNTNFTDVGTIMYAYYTANASGTLNTPLSVTAGQEIAGSLLRYNPTNYNYNSDFGTLFNKTADVVIGNRDSVTYVNGGTVLTGTWRSLGNQRYSVNQNAGDLTGNGQNNYYCWWIPILVAKIA